MGLSPDFNLPFPPLPKTLVEVTKLMEASADTPDTPGLAKVVRADPILAAFILRRVNSVHHSVRRSVDDVRQAVLLLGFQEVCNIALAVGMTEMEEAITSGQRGAIFGDIMKMSIGAAYFAQELVQHLSLPQKNRAFTLGLQHAVGRLVLLYNRPKDYEALWVVTDRHFCPPASEERKAFGTDHTELGARALQRWSYPESITAVVRNYLKPGALKENTQRGYALLLSVAVTAAEQLCMTVAGKRGKPFFTPTPATHALARMMKVSSAGLAEQIRPRREPAIRYIREMLSR